MNIYLDFESRSQADIWTTGAYRYAEDKTTEVLCLAWAVDDGSIESARCGEYLAKWKDTFNTWIAAGAIFHAHNAFFERCIWKFQMEKKYGFKPIPLVQWRDTAAKVAACALPRSLEHAAAALGCTYQKDMQGKKVMIYLASTSCPIEEIAQHLPRLMEYCKSDVATERDIDRRIPDLSEKEQKVWFMDQYINDYGIKVDMPMVRTAAVMIEKETLVLNEELKRLTGGLVNAGTQRDAIKCYLESKGLALPDLTKGTVKAAVQKADGDNLRILQLRQQLSLTSNAKYAALIAAASGDGRVRDTLVYHGASTGRWSGKLVQIQNLVKPGIDQKEVGRSIDTLLSSPDTFELRYPVLPTLSSCIRGAFIPSEGHEMFITDFAAIEARVVMWLAGEEKGLKMFRDGDADPTLPDVYVHMARAIYGNPALTKKDKAQRQLGKQAVLGCGYGMGVDKFIDTCAKYEIVIDRALGEKAVFQYRAVFAKVKAFWYALEEAIKKTIVSKQSHTCGKIRCFIEGEFLCLELPSKRLLRYHRPKVDAEGQITFMAPNSTTKRYEVTRAWGGVFVENCTQAVARDIMVDAMFALFKAGYKVLFTVHDELVVERESGKGSVDEVLKIVRQVPTWANGCPINAEAEKTERYKK